MECLVYEIRVFGSFRKVIKALGVKSVIEMIYWICKKHADQVLFSTAIIISSAIAFILIWELITL
jgi:hypothetical protein